MTKPKSRERRKPKEVREKPEQVGHSDKGDKSFKKEDQSTASDWRNVVRRVSVLGAPGSVGWASPFSSGHELRP